MRPIDNTVGTAEYLGKPTRTLEDWRYRHIGPPYVRVGRAVRYTRRDVDAWIEAQTVRPTESPT